MKEPNKTIPIVLLILLVTCQLALALTGNGTTLISSEIYPTAITLDYYYNPFIFPNTDNLLIFHYTSNSSEVVDADFNFTINNSTILINYSTYYDGYPVIINAIINNTNETTSYNAGASKTGYASSTLNGELIYTNTDKVEVTLYKGNYTTKYCNDAGYIFAINLTNIKARAASNNNQAFGIFQGMIVKQNKMFGLENETEFTYQNNVFAAPYKDCKAVLALPNGSQHSFIFSEGIYTIPGYYSKPTYTQRKNDVYLDTAFIESDDQLKFIVSDFNLNFWGSLIRYILLFIIFAASCTVAYLGFQMSGNATPIFIFLTGIIPIMLVLNFILKVILG